MIENAVRGSRTRWGQHEFHSRHYLKPACSTQKAGRVEAFGTKLMPSAVKFRITLSRNGQAAAGVELDAGGSAGDADPIERYAVYVDVAAHGIDGDCRFR